MKSKAVVFTGKNQVSVQTIESRSPTDDDVIVRITQSWISNGTEGSYLRGERSDGDRAWVPSDPPPYPVVAGYQKVGIVESIGANVTRCQVGDRVFATIGLVEGMYHWYAGHVSPSVVPQDQIWVIPPDKNPLDYAGMVLAQVGYNGGMRAPVQPGDPCVVFGDGLVGHWTAQTLSRRGAQVMLVGRHDDRLAKFADWPGAILVNEKKTPWREAIATHYPDHAQVVVDTVGSMDVMEGIVPHMKRFGHLISAGFYGTGDAMPLQPPRYRELSIHLVSGWTVERLEETFQAITRGDLACAPLITHHFSVDDAADAWELIESKRETVLGVILNW